MFRLLLVLWPILSGILVVMVACGLLAGRIEGWSLTDALYFTFVTGLTMGYGVVTPHLFPSRGSGGLNWVLRHRPQRAGGGSQRTGAAWSGDRSQLVNCVAFTLSAGRFP